ncbi:MAG: hypothetical protein FD149_2135 [Rhodospirillaceae bacterium]|nr:MAG: hypothetical protein FD149_2135 [Rhodospirillaceae bacterium]
MNNKYFPSKHTLVILIVGMCAVLYVSIYVKVYFLGP